MSDLVKRVKDADFAYCNLHRINMLPPGGLAQASGIKTLMHVIRRHRYENADLNVLRGRRMPSKCTIDLYRWAQ